MSSPNIHAYLVHPGKGIAPTAIVGEQIAGSGKLYEMLSSIFSATPSAKDFEVSFNPGPNGLQQNACRDLMITHSNAPSIPNGLAIASRLQKVTDNRPGIGLLFIMDGQHGTKKRLVVSRFPANEGILAEVNGSGLGVEYLERVFIKKMTSYKALLLEDVSPLSGYWKGFATDRQAGNSAEKISSYWLYDFLDADFAETSKAGTKRLADALKSAVKGNPSLSVKGEIASAISLAPAIFSGKMVSIAGFCQYFNLSKDAQDSITSKLTKPALASKNFQFDTAEFKTRVPYRTMEMNTGALLTAPSDQFSDLFGERPKGNGTVEIYTTGSVVDQRMQRQ
ncbi:hypothetical protein [Novosphingobium sp. YAF33]|uniref:hypothetical protein n=1 Tax=Novosphingobium sp. YAF33 TaxID=3233082 RepID=UPI003F9CD35A